MTTSFQPFLELVLFHLFHIVLCQADLQGLQRGATELVLSTLHTYFSVWSFKTVGAHQEGGLGRVYLL